jgi:hypothetical protein
MQPVKLPRKQSLLNKSKEEIATQQQKLAALQELLEQLKKNADDFTAENGGCPGKI